MNSWGFLLLWGVEPKRLKLKKQKKHTNLWSWELHGLWHVSNRLNKSYRFYFCSEKHDIFENNHGHQ